MFNVPMRILAVFLVIFAPPAFAWWDAGHEIVAKIAYDRLTPAAKMQADKCATILARDYPEILVFSNMATWPDHLRSQKIETFTHWHYINIPFSDDGSPLNFAIDTDNAIWAVTQTESIVHNPKVNPVERARFLAFLVHIVGDLHQPLHNVSRISKEHPNGDEGGNLFLVKNPNNPAELMPLHSLWDSDFGAFDVNAKPDVNKLAATITARYPEKYFGDKVTDLSVQDWSKEGVSLAQEFLYKTPGNQVPSVDYQVKGKDLAEQRVALAGYRLANLLNALLD